MRASAGIGNLAEWRAEVGLGASEAAASQSRWAHEPAGQSAAPDAEQQFKAADLNGDGVIDAQELKAAMAKAKQSTAQSHSRWSHAGVTATSVPGAGHPSTVELKATSV